MQPDPHAVDLALRQVIAHADYDLHKSIERDEDTGADTYAEHVTRFVTEYLKVPKTVTDAEVEAACEVMHDAYERAATDTGWETQAASRKPWADVPEANKATMRVAVRALLSWLA